MGKSLYREYRSTSFDEIIGQDHIVQVLKNSIANQTISHAYLLSGPRGTGKTSIARILAHEVNGHVYDSEATNLDIIEIDAASNRRIDEIREIKERVNIAPIAGTYKVYIIDEVHMLTKEAFNALLKTLEEPPAHVIFVLATTEFHKVPETITSRCIKLTFKPIPLLTLKDHLRSIADKENIEISKEALELVAEHGRGSFRDAISLLDQVRGLGKTIDIDIVSAMLGLAPKTLINELISATSAQDPSTVHQKLTEAFDAGANESILASQLSDQLRSNLIKQGDEGILSKDSILNLLHDLLEVPSSPKPRIALELALLKANLAKSNSTKESPDPALDTPQQTEQQPDTPDSKTASTEETTVDHQTKSASEPTTSNTVVTESPRVVQDLPSTKKPPAPKINKNNEKSNPTDPQQWQHCLELIRDTNKTLYGVARMAEINIEKNEVILQFKFAFHYKQVTDSKNISVLSEVIKSVYGDEYTCRPSLIQAEQKPVDTETSLKNVSNIFGGHEVIES